MPLSPTQKRRSPDEKLPWIRRRDQGRLLVLAASLLLMSVSYWWLHGGHRGELVEIDRADPRTANFLVDINQADWPEMIQLPGLGEITARKILAEREQNGPFEQVDDLVRVNGIGPKTLEKIRPYLLPIPGEKDWASVDRGDIAPVQ